jgi:hypothetical protein
MLEWLWAAKNYVLQFVLGHQLVVARPDGMRATTVHNVRGFQDCLDELLGAVVDAGGRVDYDRLREPEQQQRLSNAVQFVANHSPLVPADAGMFDTRNKRLAFYMNAYNALVLWGVIRNWPLASVHECKAWVRLLPSSLVVAVWRVGWRLRSL